MDTVNEIVGPSNLGSVGICYRSPLQEPLPIDVVPPPPLRGVSSRSGSEGGVFVRWSADAVFSACYKFIFSR